MAGVLEWLAFLVFAAIALAGALSMLLTMSMYRAGLFLMASLVSLAGLFVLLSAPLLAAVQIMMNVGGMMVMILFMVMLMMDPGGEMMWNMKRSMHLPGLAALSMSMPRRRRGKPAPDEDGDMMAGMAMSTEQLPWAIAIGAITAAALVLFVVIATWPPAAPAPNSDAPRAVGDLLLNRYMIAFEGAAFLILAGIVGAVIIGRREVWQEPPAPGGRHGEEDEQP